jgi:hypothetical protein
MRAGTELRIRKTACTVCEVAKAIGDGHTTWSLSHWSSQSRQEKSEKKEKKEKKAGIDTFWDVTRLPSSSTININ